METFMCCKVCFMSHPLIHSESHKALQTFTKHVQSHSNLKIACAKTHDMTAQSVKRRNVEYAAGLFDSCVSGNSIITN